MTSHYTQLWREARTRFSNQLHQLSKEDVAKTLGEAPNSIGFLIRHIAEVELLFAKNVFGNSDLKISAKTIIEGKDTGKWTNLDELILFAEEAYEKLEKAIQSQADDAWKTEVTTQEFGTKTLAEAFGRIVSHTAYHAGQLAIINKYGK